MEVVEETKPDGALEAAEAGAAEAVERATSSPAADCGIGRGAQADFGRVALAAGSALTAKPTSLAAAADGVMVDSLWLHAADCSSVCSPPSLSAAASSTLALGMMVRALEVLLSPSGPSVPRRIECFEDITAREGKWEERTERLDEVGRVG